PRHDMSPIVTAMSRVTKHIGFGLTFASTFMHPFYIARLFNSLDHVTDGRMAFNVIASSRGADAANYGFDELMEHGLRYERMEEFIDVCRKLWGSVGPEAFEWNRESGVVADPALVHAINHAGKFFKVRGPLNCMPSPQVEPVLIQAGSSPRGVKASAYISDHVFARWPTKEGKAKHRAQLDREAIAIGRDPEKIGILWGCGILVAETAHEANACREKLLTMIPREAIGPYLSHNSGYDFSTLPSRFKLGELNKEIAAKNASPVGFVYKLGQSLGEDTEVTREEFFEYGLRTATNYDRTFAGTASSLADMMEEEFEAGGSRGGFMVVHPQAVPRDLLNVVDLLVPELQRRGRFRKAYEGKTLRENLAAG
ncbi:MAG: flavin-dependent alkanal monooxygenase, partial [Hyphomicrobiales bacterium]|nr:flavin-dependent alkanal monooxygenase [Hyphomicrobiales bacterium]